MIIDTFLSKPCIYNCNVFLFFVKILIFFFYNITHYPYEYIAKIKRCIIIPQESAVRFKLNTIIIVLNSRYEEDDENGFNISFNDIIFFLNHTYLSLNVILTDITTMFITGILANSACIGIFSNTFFRSSAFVYKIIIKIILSKNDINKTI